MKYNLLYNASLYSSLCKLHRWLSWHHHLSLDGSLLQADPGQESLVAGQRGALEVLEQTSTLMHQQRHASSVVVVVSVAVLEMLVEVSDAVGEDGSCKEWQSA